MARMARSTRTKTSIRMNKKNYYLISGLNNSGVEVVVYPLKGGIYTTTFLSTQVVVKPLLNYYLTTTTT
jgi:hypothetical protein